MNYRKLITIILFIVMILLISINEINNNKEYQFGDFKITKKEINQMIKFQQKEFNYTDDVARICSIETGDCFIIGKIK